MQDDSQQQDTGITDSADSVTEVTYTSWWDRIKQSVIGMGFGLILVGGAIWLLFWNEGRAVQTARALSEGAGLVISVEGAKRDAANDGKLIHVSGDAKAAAPLSDAEFGMTARGLRLVRHVEMYQWKEDRKQESRSRLGGGQETVTTYDYRRVWSKDAINASQFRESRNHQNPQMLYKDRAINAADVTLGGFKPGEDIISRLGEGAELAVPAALEPALRAQRREPVQVADGKILIGDAASPRIGDYRIWYTSVPEGPVSIAARQQGDGLASYTATNGRTVLLVRTGVHSAVELFDEAKQENKLISWILRGAGALAMLMGWSLLLRPVVVLADVVPLFGSIAGFGAGLIAGVLTLIIAPLVIAIAWFYHRPLVSLSIAAAGLAAGFGLKQWRGQTRPAVRPVPAQAAPAQAASFIPQQQGGSFLPPRQR